jgi:hypothetical protein
VQARDIAAQPLCYARLDPYPVALISLLLFEVRLS